LPALMKEFNADLPSVRLTIKQYAVRFSQTVIEKYHKDGIDLEKKLNENEFHVIGFDDDSEIPIHLQFRIPGDPTPAANLSPDIIAGDLTETICLNATADFRTQLWSTLKAKKSQDTLGGEDLAIYRDIKNERPFQGSLGSENLRRFGELLIKRVSSENVKTFAAETVGGVEQFVITPTVGSNASSLEYPGTLLADAQHRVDIQCCSRYRVQIAADKPAPPGYESFPANDIFECRICGKTILLDKVRERYETELSRL